MPQLALLKITVYDDQSKQVGHRVLPVVGLRPGYRYVVLKNESNQPLLMNALFVHITMHDYVPEEYEEFANALVNPISYITSLSKKEEMLKTLTDDNEVIFVCFSEVYLEDLESRGSILWI
jgi:phosphatidylinositol phospholipase C beta